MKRVISQKINDHNERVTEYCMMGQKNLVSHFKEPMSLQKIQVELSVIRKIAEPVLEGDINLGIKIWNDFKQWHNEPKYIRKQNPSIKTKPKEKS